MRKVFRRTVAQVSNGLMAANSQLMQSTQHVTQVQQ